MINDEEVITDTRTADWSTVTLVSLEATTNYEFLSDNELHLYDDDTDEYLSREIPL